MLPERATHAHALIRVDGKYALQLRDDDAPTSPGVWGLFGGTIEPDESPWAAIVREIAEELDLDAGAAVSIGQYEHTAMFVFEATDHWPAHVLHEGQAAALFTAEQTLKLNLAPHVKLAIQDYEAAMVRA